MRICGDGGKQGMAGCCHVGFLRCPAATHVVKASCCRVRLWTAQDIHLATRSAGLPARHAGALWAAPLVLHCRNIDACVCVACGRRNLPGRAPSHDRAAKAGSRQDPAPSRWTAAPLQAPPSSAAGWELAALRRAGMPLPLPPELRRRCCCRCRARSPVERFHCY